MHPALAIPELQFAIACEVNLCPSLYWLKEHHDALYRLMMVSRSWKNIVEPLLWERMIFNDMLFLIPAWSCAGGRKVEITVHRAVTASDWESVCSRSCFTRWLYVDFPNFPDALDEDVLATLPPADVLFQRLENMTLTGPFVPPSLMSRYLVALMPHTLSHLTIERASFMLRGIPALVAARCVHLRSLEMRGLGKFVDSDIPRPSPCAAFLESLRACRELADVDIAFRAFEYSASYLCSLAAYPILRRLKLEVHEAKEEPEELGVHCGFPARGFVVLQSLELSFVPCRTVTAALESIGGSTQLTTIIITVDITDYESYHAIVAAISSAGHPAHLTTVQLYRYSSFVRRLPSYGVLDMKILTLLSRFRLLETMVMTGLARSALTINDCAKIASWWPELARLTLVTKADHNASCMLEVLGTFRVCPRLTELYIALAETERDDVYSA
ncbi:hypothetical protein BD626DRAFT_517612 [Schizophyllum amplum]|uniref:F-box domain-containing protein n=1 Tax=Schizophyllum amplum TaxID=97359 RepID=A0A550BW28_9AGAR|nr:hypothetical protein BD626DRAFT_517612 [Auriculariopsis ampla]